MYSELQDRDYDLPDISKECKQNDLLEPPILDVISLRHRRLLNSSSILVPSCITHIQLMLTHHGF